MLQEIAALFLKLGFLGFGGPLATISMMEEETVKKRGWFKPEVFSRNYSLLKVFPGPTSTQLAIRLGGLRGGVGGGIVAGLCFLLPAVFIILVLGIFLNKLEPSQSKSSFVLGMQVSALAIILQGAWRLARANIKGDGTLFILLVSFFLVLYQPTLEVQVILCFGVLGVLLVKRGNKFLREGATFLLAFICLKAALLTFGTGLAIVPLLHADVVDKYHWLSHGEFLEALALGQVTPGPVVVTVTWIGYKMLGAGGVVVATLAVFVPGFFISLGVVPYIEKKWGSSKEMESFYRCVVPAVVGAMFAVTVKLLYTSLHSKLAVTVFFSSGLLLLWKKTPPWFLIPVFGFLSIYLEKYILFVTPYFF